MVWRECSLGHGGEKRPGALTPEHGLHRGSWKAMLAYKSGSLETADRGVESHTDHRSAARTPALNTATPIAYLDMVVVFCEFFGQTPHGLRYGGDMPLFILKASQPGNIHSELASANYHSHDIEQALKRGHWLHENHPEHAREAIAFAEHNAQEGRK